MPVGLRRGWISVFLFTLAMINYTDRVALSVAGGAIAREFGLSPVQMGYLHSSFLWSYLVCLIPMGVLVDRYGSRVVNAAGITVWSAITALTGAAGSYVALFAARLVMGAGESSTFPAGGRVVREWIPAGERGLVNAIFMAGTQAGPAFGAILVAWLVSLVGWRLAFALVGSIGFLWLAAWLRWFDRPERVGWLGEAERAHILRERDAAPAALAGGGGLAGVRALLRNRSMWGLALSEGCAVYTQYLFLTWLPGYLQATRHLGILKTGAYTALPYASAMVLGIALGRVSDRVLAGGGLQGGRRRNMVVLMLLGSAVILFAPMVEQIWLLMLLFTLSLTGMAAAIANNFSLVNDLLREPSHSGAAMGILVVGGNAFGILAPILTGYVISATGSFDAAFAIAGVLLVIGALISLTMTRDPITVQHA